MVDWERVERLRSKGMGWEEISHDAKVHFSPPDGVEDSGRALKTLYYSRKSSRGPSAKKKGGTGAPTAKETLRKFLVPGGLGLVVLGAVWFLMAYLVSYVGVLTPAFPDVLLVLIAGALLMTVGSVLGTARLSEVWKKPVALGLVLGLVLSGGLALAGYGLGIPNLSTFTYSEPGGWLSESPRNAVWSSNGQPVFFYVGSIACPYCSASSWAYYLALSDFGTLSGTQLGHSNPGDTPASIPEVEFVSATYASNYINLDAKEGNVDTQITLPPLSLTEQAYVSTYNTHQSIPFIVVGGMFIHVGAIVDPTVLQGLSPQQVLNDLRNTTADPTVYNAIHGPALYLEAYFVKADQIAGVTPPSSVTSDGAVMNIVNSIQ